MTRHRRQRLMTSLVLVAFLLFQQVAMAAYACTMTQAPENAAAMSGECAAMSTPLPSTAVCEKHCSPDPTFTNGQTIPVPPALALPPVVHDLVLLQPYRTATINDVPLARSDPPPRLRYCRLLI